MMKKSETIKIAKMAGVDLSLISITYSNGECRIEKANLPNELAKANIKYAAETGEQLPEVARLIKKYNREAKKLFKALGGNGWSFETGYGAWFYTTGSPSQSRKLALANID